MRCHDEVFKDLGGDLNRMLPCNEGKHYKDCPDDCLGIEIKCMCGMIMRKFTDFEVSKLLWDKYKKDSEKKPLPTEN